MSVIDTKKLRVGSAFSGIGAWEKALTNLGINHKLEWYIENDKHASTSFAAIHDVSEDLNVGDITKIDTKDLSDIDMLVYSPPCQSFSVSGKQKGTKDPRGRLFYNTLPIIKDKKPKYALMENVKGLTQKRFERLFNDMLEELDMAGYNNYYEVLNAVDFGIPQNRERVFIVSIRKDIDNGSFNFPDALEKGFKLIDLLEDSVTEGEYLQGSNISSMLDDLENIGDIGDKIICAQRGRYDEEGKVVQRLEVQSSGNSNTLTTVQKDNLVLERKLIVDDSVKPSVAKNFNRELSDIALSDKGIYQCKCDSGWQDNKVGLKYSPTLRAGNSHTSVLDSKYRIRKLTPLENWRLMGFNDEDFEKARQSLMEVYYNGRDRTKTQMYKQAGNSIVVNVVEEIFRKLLLESTNE